MDPVNVLANYEVHSSTHSWDNSNWNFGFWSEVANPQSWEEEAVEDRGWYCSKEWCYVKIYVMCMLMSSYRPSIVTFSLSLRVSEILSLLSASTLLFPTPCLVSPKFFPYSPVNMCWPGYKERRCCANCPCNYFSRISNLCDADPPTLQIEGRQTERRHAIARPRFAR